MLEICDVTPVAIAIRGLAASNLRKMITSPGTITGSWDYTVLEEQNFGTGVRNRVELPWYRSLKVEHKPTDE